MKLSEWAMEPLSGNYLGLIQKRGKPGLNTRRNAAHIIVYDRYLQVLEEELIAPIVVLAMRNMYQSAFGALMKSAGVYRYLQVRFRWTGLMAQLRRMHGTPPCAEHARDGLLFIGMCSVQCYTRHEWLDETHSLVRYCHRGPRSCAQMNLRAHLTMGLNNNRWRADNVRRERQVHGQSCEQDTNPQVHQEL